MWWLLACAQQTEELSSTALLTRWSLDLRGYRPSVEELDQAQQDFQKEDAKDLWLEKWMHDANFPRQMADMLAPVYDTRQDETLYPAEELGLLHEFRFAYAVGDEPMRVVEEVIRRDMPWETIVTADWTMVNQDLAEIYDVELLEEFDSTEEQWRKAVYRDGRPPAGVLSGNGLWWRYETSRNNASRGRANQISRVFLCQDFLAKPVQFDASLNLTSVDSVENAIQNHPSCVACHASLDPLASLLGGVFVPRKSGATEMLYYHPERESIWLTQTGAFPSYFGSVGYNLGDLGRFIAADGQFISCTVEQAMEGLLHQPFDISMLQESLEHRNEFVRHHTNYRYLVHSIITSQRYVAKIWDGQSNQKIVSPIQLAQQIEAITGFRFYSNEYDMLRSPTVGLYTMAGGTVGTTVGSDDISVTLSMLQTELSNMAVEYWFQTEEPINLPFGVNSLGDKETQQENILYLHRLILGVEPTETETNDMLVYIKALSAEYEPTDIWKSVARILLQDPRFLVY